MSCFTVFQAISLYYIVIKSHQMNSVVNRYNGRPSCIFRFGQICQRHLQQRLWYLHKFSNVQSVLFDYFQFIWLSLRPSPSGYGVLKLDVKTKSQSGVVSVLVSCPRVSLGAVWCQGRANRTFADTGPSSTFCQSTFAALQLLGLTHRVSRRNTSGLCEGKKHPSLFSLFRYAV